MDRNRYGTGTVPIDWLLAILIVRYLRFVYRCSGVFLVLLIFFL